MDLLEFNTVPELRAIARENKLKGYSKMRKAELIDFLNASLSERGDDQYDDRRDDRDENDEEKHDRSDENTYDYKSIILDELQSESKELFKEGQRRRALGLSGARKAIKDWVPNVFSVDDVTGVDGVGKGTIRRVAQIIGRGPPTTAPSSWKSNSFKSRKTIRRKPSKKSRLTSRSASRSKSDDSTAGVSGARARVVEKKHVMLAGDLAKKPKSFKVDGWWASKKWDGVRGLTDAEGRLYTRRGNRIYVPKFIADAIPKGHLFDGEIESEDGFGAMNSIWRSGADDERWHGVTYRVFDLRDDPDLPVEKRWARLEKIVEEADHDVLVYVPQRRIKNRAEAERLMQKVVKEGGEGIVLREPGSLYEEGRRSHSMLKVKPLEDAEAIVIGPVKGKDSLHVKWVKNPNVRFKLSTLGQSPSKFPPGTIVTVEFSGYQPSGKPRIPVLLRVRGGYD